MFSWYRRSLQIGVWSLDDVGLLTESIQEFQSALNQLCQGNASANASREFCHDGVTFLGGSK